MELAPVILFVFDRPLHTTLTLKALSQNVGIRETILYVYADGPKSNSTELELQRIQEVKTIIKKIDWIKEIHIIERDKNYGLAGNIIDGITTVLNFHESAIIIEDDIVTSSGFLDYMNQALKIYQKEKEVMHISGYMFPIQTDDIGSPTFFYNTASCWGWATWADRWKQLITDPHYIWSELEKGDSFKKFNIEGWANFSKQLRDNIRGIKHTWAIKWYGTIFLNNGYALHPKYSLVRNIGNDDSGENSKRTDYYNTGLYDKIEVSKIHCQENPVIRQRMRDFYFYQKPFKHKILKFISPILPKRVVNTPFF